MKLYLAKGTCCVQVPQNAVRVYTPGLLPEDYLLRDGVLRDGERLEACRFFFTDADRRVLELWHSEHDGPAVRLVPGIGPTRRMGGVEVFGLEETLRSKNWMALTPDGA